MAGWGGALIAIMLVGLGLVGGAAATTYDINAPGSNGAGWVYLTSPNDSYDDTLKNTTLFIGDILSFRFAIYAHDVYEVAPAAVANCDVSDPVQVHTKSVDVILRTAGQHGFVCSLPSHCSTYGMHLLVTVLEAPGPPPGGPEAAALDSPASALQFGPAMTFGALFAASAVLAL